MGDHALSTRLYRGVVTGKLLMVNWFLPLMDTGLLPFSFTNGKFRISLHAVNCCCDVGFLNSR